MLIDRVMDNCAGIFIFIQDMMQLMTHGDESNNSWSRRDTSPKKGKEMMLYKSRISH